MREGDVVSGEEFGREDAVGGPLDRKEGARVRMISIFKRKEELKC
jgi:hypothetical protein